MVKDDIAYSVLNALGGRTNVLTNTVCMTRLRVTLQDPSVVDYESLSEVQGVLGTATRGHNGLEVVFGPRLIDGIYHAFLKLTGVAAGSDALFPMSRQESSMRVKISRVKSPAEQTTSPSKADDTAEPTRTKTPVAKPPVTNARAQSDEDIEDERSEGTGAQTMDAEDISVLQDLLNDGASRSGNVKSDLKLLVINGPNLNMLGIREPDLYGSESFPALLDLCKEAAAEAGFVRCDCYQSNHEGDLVDTIQDAYGVYDGIVINPGAYTHTSVALLDALKAVSIPTVEVHISKVDEREEFRQVSYVRLACFETITGLGIEGYRKAIHDLAAHLRAH